MMRNLSRTFLAAVAVAGTVVAGGAVVGAPGAEAAADDVTRGVTGCVAFSYKNGFRTTTVYLHNRCGGPRTVTIRDGSQCSDPDIRIKGGDYTTHKVYCQVSDVIGG